MKNISKLSKEIKRLKGMDVVFHKRNDGKCAEEFFCTHMNHLIEKKKKKHDQVREWMHTGRYKEIVYPDDPNLGKKPMYVFKILDFIQYGQAIPLYLKVQENNGKILAVSLHKYLCNR